LSCQVIFKTKKRPFFSSIEQAFIPSFSPPPISAHFCPKTYEVGLNHRYQTEELEAVYREAISGNESDKGLVP
jgi:hypothetical protein